MISEKRRRDIEEHKRINTTQTLAGQRPKMVREEVQPNQHEVQTVENTYDAMVYTDEPPEPEVVETIPCGYWGAAVLETEEAYRVVPLVCWSRVRVGEAELLYGVGVIDGVVDLTENLADRSDFMGYVKLGMPLGGVDVEALLEEQTIQGEV